MELHTHGLVAGARPRRRGRAGVATSSTRALVGAGRALQTVASVLLMSDPHDLGMVAQVRSPHAERPVIYLWETVPGGVGLSTRLFERTAELIDGRPGAGGGV